MKKSEAIKKIEWYINEQNSGNVVGEQILNLVEGIGMLPPTNPGHIKFIEKSVTGGRTEYEYFDVNVWEPE